MDDNSLFADRVDLSGLRQAVDSIRAEIAKVIVGQQEMVDLLVAALLADGHVLIEGVPGVAKTLSARLLARTIRVEFSRIQFTPDLMPSDVLGTSVFNPQTAEFAFRRGPAFSNIVLIDEINRAPAKTQSALFEIMEERQATVDGSTYPMDAPFVVVATQNPVEHEGTYRLPEAQLDRFLFKIEVRYPSLSQEAEILRASNARISESPLDQVAAVLGPEQLAEYRASVRRIHCEDKLLEYIAAIVHATRSNKSLFLGASPRASLGILAAAKAFAAIDGRDFVKPEDIANVACPVMRHRVVLTPEKEMEGALADDVIRQILRSIEVPR